MFSRLLLGLFALILMFKPTLGIADCGVHDEKIDVDGYSYDVRALNLGDSIRGEIVYVPNCAENDKSMLVIEIDVNSLNREHLYNIFVAQNKESVGLYPYSVRGVETVLTPQKLIYRIHPGVLISFRNEFFSAVKVSELASIEPEITAILGNVYITQARKKIALEQPSFFSSSVISSEVMNRSAESRTTLPDGSTMRTLKNYDAYLPSFYLPRLTEEER